VRDQTGVVVPAQLQTVITEKFQKNNQRHVNGLITLPRSSSSITLLAILVSFSLTSVVNAQTQGDQICEVCGMTTSPEAQARYAATDGTGTVHYVECFMCALNLVKDYSKVHIVTCCDWYGPEYTITVDSNNFGNEVTVNPPTAMFLNGGSCVINRAAYNQTAADMLLANGYSQFTLSDQHYALPSNTKVTNALNAALEYGKESETTGSPQTNVVLIAVAVMGAVVIAGSLLAFRKMRNSTNGERNRK
jgi:hypothetical protein